MYLADLVERLTHLYPAKHYPSCHNYCATMTIAVGNFEGNYFWDIMCFSRLYSIQTRREISLQN